MGNSRKNEDSLDVIRGTLDILILKTLSMGPKHGYEISKWIGQQTRTAIQVEEGALYPALRRMEKKGWLDSEWGLSDTNREVKFYTLTTKGQAHLQTEMESWNRYVEAMSFVLQAAGGTS